MFENPEIFHNILRTWYLKHKRDLPWREQVSPYLIWLSEIILQQTRVDQGLPYYFKFIAKYPTIFDLAAASEEEVLKLWQGLGYYSRARNLHATARKIANERNGHFPDTYAELKKLKGIGDYTASAIASICFNEPTAVVDGNVYRVLSRIFGISTPVNSTAGIKEFKALAQRLIDRADPGTFNQAIMEFGARHCVPQNPDCTSCVFAANCEALRIGAVRDLPVKLAKKPLRKRYFNYIVMLSEEHDSTWLRQRNGKGIWQQLYEFPLVETEKEVSVQELKEHEDYKELCRDLCVEELTLYNEEAIVHKLSHQHINTRFWIVRTNNSDEKAVPFSEIANYPVPVLIENFISEFPVFKN